MSFQKSKVLLDHLTIEQIGELYARATDEISGMRVKLTKEQTDITASYEDFLQEVEDGDVKMVSAEKAAKMIGDLITIIAEISDYDL